jgi:hypothetical protein
MLSTSRHRIDVSAECDKHQLVRAKVSQHSSMPVFIHLLERWILTPNALEERARRSGARTVGT